MCRDVQTPLPANLEAAWRARAFVRTTCARWEIDEPLTDQLVMGASELVTNAVVHAHSASVLAMSVVGSTVEVSVSDADPRRPQLRPSRVDLLADLDALAPFLDERAAADADHRHPSLTAGAAGSVTAGRGLQVVAALADSWGSAPRGAGKAVWLSVTAPHWPYRHGCRCAAGRGGRTASGRAVTHLPEPWRP